MASSLFKKNTFLLFGGPVRCQKLIAEMWVKEPVFIMSTVAVSLLLINALLLTMLMGLSTVYIYYCSGLF
jgi:hypothetical protein